jgi:ribosomal protein L37AE/L43A
MSNIYFRYILKVLLFGILFYREKLLNYNVSLTEFDSILITVKACPICNSRTIEKRKKGYYCGKCRITFSQPALKHVENNRNILPIPLYLSEEKK